jgi:EpsI family protein
MILVLTAGGVWWVNQQTHGTLTSEVAKRALPTTLTIDGITFGSEDLELTETEQIILETRDYLYRRFTAGGQWVDFSIIFSQDNRKGTHPPDLCLEGSGGNIVYKRDLIVPDVPGRGNVPCRELITRAGSQGIYVLYTYKCGSEYTNSFWWQQGMIWMNGLLHRNASGALIRVVVPIADLDPEPARQRATAFMQAGVPHIDANLP